MQRLQRLQGLQRVRLRRVRRLWLRRLQLLLVMGILSHLLDLSFADCVDRHNAAWAESSQPGMRKLRRCVHGCLDSRVRARRGMVIVRAEKLHPYHSASRPEIGASVRNNRERRAPLEVCVLVS